MLAPTAAEADALSTAFHLLGPEGAAAYRAAPGWEGHRRWVTRNRTNAVFLNTELAPFDQLAVRRAVAFAIDPSVLEIDPQAANAENVAGAMGRTGPSA